MATEKRLIDAKPFMKAGWHLVRTGKSNEYLASLSLADVPTVDAVEVVRCKDCSHAIINENHPNKPLICCLTRMCGTTKPEWFCADGERKDNGTV